LAEFENHQFTIKVDHHQENHAKRVKNRHTTRVHQGHENDSGDVSLNQAEAEGLSSVQTIQFSFVREISRENLIGT
jgi:hypothetical protein